MIIYSNGEKIDINCIIYDPFPSKKEEKDEKGKSEEIENGISSQDLQTL